MLLNEKAVRTYCAVIPGSKNLMYTILMYRQKCVPYL